MLFLSECPLLCSYITILFYSLTCDWGHGCYAVNQNKVLPWAEMSNRRKKVWSSSHSIGVSCSDSLQSVSCLTCDKTNSRSWFRVRRFSLFVLIPFNCSIAGAYSFLWSVQYMSWYYFLKCKGSYILPSCMLIYTSVSHSVSVTGHVRVLHATLHVHYMHTSLNIHSKIALFVKNGGLSWFIFIKQSCFWHLVLFVHFKSFFFCLTVYSCSLHVCHLWALLL